MAVEDVINGEIKEKTLILKTKSGKEKIAETQTGTILFNNQPYIIGKIKNISDK